MPGRGHVTGPAVLLRCFSPRSCSRSPRGVLTYIRALESGGGDPAGPFLAGTREKKKHTPVVTETTRAEEKSTAGARSNTNTVAAGNGDECMTRISLEVLIENRGDQRRRISAGRNNEDAGLRTRIRGAAPAPPPHPIISSTSAAKIRQIPPLRLFERANPVFPLLPVVKYERESAAAAAIFKSFQATLGTSAAIKETGVWDDGRPRTQRSCNKIIGFSLMDEVAIVRSRLRFQLFLLKVTYDFIPNSRSFLLATC